LSSGNILSLFGPVIAIIFIVKNLIGSKNQFKFLSLSMWQILERWIMQSKMLKLVQMILRIT